MTYTYDEYDNLSDPLDGSDATIETNDELFDTFNTSDLEESYFDADTTDDIVSDSTITITFGAGIYASGSCNAGSGQMHGSGG
jgi:hypothetical protein